MSASQPPTTTTTTTPFTPDLTQPLHIIIIGGSLSALFTAIPLLRLSVPHTVTILERSPTPLLHDQGAGIVAGEPTQTWFERFDATGKEMGVVSKERLYLDHRGRVVDGEGMRQRMMSWGGCWGVGRGNFDGECGGGKGWREVMGGLGGYGEEVMRGWERARYEIGRKVEGLEESDGGRKVVVKWRDVREGSATWGEEGRSVADYVICADGPSSQMREVLLGEEKAAKRKYAGYVAFRGTVPEEELSAAAREVFVEKFTFFHMDESQILAYTIPGNGGALEKGKRLVNYVWYWNMEEGGEEMKEVFTDSDGNWHRFTLPTGGKMQKKVWDRQVQRAREFLPPQFAEIVQKTKEPFVQSITDVEPPEKGTQVARFLNGKVALVGDALAGFRPHTAASTSQAAFDAQIMERLFSGAIGWDEYEEIVLDFATKWQQRGVMLGERSQFGRHPLAEGRRGGGDVKREELHMRSEKTGV